MPHPCSCPTAIWTKGVLGGRDCPWASFPLAENRAVAAQRAGIIHAEGQRLKRAGPGGGAAIRVVAPAVQATLGVQAAAVGAARVNGGKSDVRRRGGAAVLVPAPAGCRAFCIQGAGVLLAGGHCRKFAGWRQSLAVCRTPGALDSAVGVANSAEKPFSESYLAELFTPNCLIYGVCGIVPCSTHPARCLPVLLQAAKNVLAYGQLYERVIGLLR